MKLHVVLDSHITKQINKDDIALFSAYNFVDNSAICDSRIVNTTLSNEDERVATITNDVLSTFPSEFLYISNEVYARFLKPLFMYIANVEAILKEARIDEIVLYEGSTIPFFSTEGAEGEGLRNDYKSNWMVNAFLWYKYKDIYNITWINQENSTCTRLRNYKRFVKQVSLLLAARIIRRIRSHNKIVRNIDSKTIISIVSLKLQLVNLRCLLQDLSSYRQLSYSFSRELVNEKDVFEINELSVWKLFSIFWGNNRALRKTKPIFIKNVRSQSIKREIGYIMLKFRIRESRVMDTLSSAGINKNAVFVSNATYGSEIVLIHKVAQHFGLRHVNFQYVSMEKLCFPNMNLADEYFLYAKKTYEFYHNYNTSFKLYFPAFSQASKFKIKQDLFTLSIFVQPDNYVYDFISYLRIVLSSLKSSGLQVKVIIKPHYRQNKLDSIKSVIEGYDFAYLAGLSDDCGSILSITDLAMSISSSVVFESLMYRVPCLVYNPDNKYYNDIYCEDICFPDVNYVIGKAEDTLNYIKNYNDYKNEFDKRMNNYLTKNNAQTNIPFIINKLFD